MARDGENKTTKEGDAFAIASFVVPPRGTGRA